MAATSFKIGIIIGSTRVRRVGPQVATFVQDAVQLPLNGTDDLRSRTRVDVIDLKDFNLPLFDEPGIPNRCESSEDYANEHTRVWSRHITKYDAFVFLSAQRNWGIPAELKNAIDYLFHEWKGKPAMIISYGGHGGAQCAEQIKIVTGAMGMRVVEKMVHMKFASRDHLQKGFEGGPLGLDASDKNAPWSDYVPEINSAFWNDLVRDKLDT